MINRLSDKKKKKRKEEGKRDIFLLLWPILRWRNRKKRRKTMSNSTPTSSIHPNQLDRDETRVLDECDRESFIYRSIPAGITAYFAIQYAISTNRISIRYKWLKIGGSVLLACFIGKISYTSACKQKILEEIPNSNLAALIRGYKLENDVSVTSKDQH